VGRKASIALAAALASVLATAAVAARPDADRITGTKGADVLRGSAGPDLLLGRAGRDRLIGGRGKDTLRGGPGRDEFNMRAGAELQGRGADRIDARDGAPDEINCGAGRDLAIVDAIEDGVIACEVVREP
jgi:hypothetical protein